MKESVWGYMVIVAGVIIIFIIFFFQNVTNTDEHNMTLLKEVTEASMNDAIDWTTYKDTGRVKITEDVFVESFIRRFPESAQLSSVYRIEIYNVQEEPPIVNIRVLSTESTNYIIGSNDFTVTNTINTILETDTKRAVAEIE